MTFEWPKGESEKHGPFARAIIATPEDESLRLVYADFLRERAVEGDVRVPVFETWANWIEGKGIPDVESIRTIVSILIRDKEPYDVCHVARFIEGMRTVEIVEPCKADRDRGLATENDGHIVVTIHVWEMLYTTIGATAIKQPSLCFIWRNGFPDIWVTPRVRLGRQIRMRPARPSDENRMPSNSTVDLVVSLLPVRRLMVSHYNRSRTEGWLRLSYVDHTSSLEYAKEVNRQAEEINQRTDDVVADVIARRSKTQNKQENA